MCSGRFGLFCISGHKLKCALKQYVNLDNANNEDQLPNHLRGHERLHVSKPKSIIPKKRDGKPPATYFSYVLQIALNGLADMSVKKLNMLSFRNVLNILIFAVAGVFIIPQFAKISGGLYKNFLASSVTFNLDTLYLNWNTPFPAVTVCELYNGERIWDISEEYFGSNKSSQIDDYLGEILFFRGTCMSCKNCEYIGCPTDFNKLMNIFRTNCSDLFKNCSWANHPFDCCSEFLPIKTEYGICFSFNSNHARKVRRSKYSNNRVTGPGRLQFFVSRDVQVHIHPPTEIPFLFSDGVFRETVLWGTAQDIMFNVVELYNDPSVRTQDPEKRRCRFSNEVRADFKLYNFYSFSTCVVECMRNLKLYVCNCTDHFLASDEEFACNEFGLICLTEAYHIMREQRKECKCLSTCEEPEYEIVHNSGEGATEDGLIMSKVMISMVDLPTQRYVRIVSKNYLDLIISVGGIASLFFGASLIKMFEVIYFAMQYKIRLFLILRQKVKRK